MCTNQDISKIPFIMRGNHFLVHGHKKDFPHITCIFYLLKYVVKDFFSVSHFTSHFFANLLDSYLNNISRYVLFNPIFCALAPLNCPHTYLATLLRPCYDPGRSTVAMDAAGTQRGLSEEPKDAQGRRPSANILNMIAVGSPWDAI